MEEALRRTSLAPLASPCFALRSVGVETEDVLDYHCSQKDYKDTFSKINVFGELIS